MDPVPRRQLYPAPATSSPPPGSPPGPPPGTESAGVPTVQQRMGLRASEQQQQQQQRPGPGPGPDAQPHGVPLKCHHCSLTFESISKRRTHMRTHQKQTTVRLRDAQGGTSVTVLRVSESSPWFCPLYGCFYSTRHTSSLHPHIRVCYSLGPVGREKQCLRHYKLEQVPEPDPQKLFPAMGPTPDPIVNAHGLIPGTERPAWNEAPPLDAGGGVGGAAGVGAGAPGAPPAPGRDLYPTSPSAARPATQSPARRPSAPPGHDRAGTTSVPRGSQQRTTPTDGTPQQQEATSTQNVAQPEGPVDATEAADGSNPAQPHDAPEVSESAHPEATQTQAAAEATQPNASPFNASLLGDAGAHPDGLDQLARAASLADALPANVARGRKATPSAHPRSHPYGPADSDDELDGTPPPGTPGSPLTPPPPEPAPAAAGPTTNARFKDEPRTKQSSASAPSTVEQSRVGRVLYPLWPEGQREVDDVERDQDGSIVCPKPNCMYTTQSATLLKKHAKNCRPTEQRNKHWHGQKRRDRHFCPHHTCNAEFTTKGQLRAHRRLLHQMKIDRLLYPLRTQNEAVVENVERQEDGKFHCPQEACTYKHQSPELLRKHAQTCGRPRASDGTKSRAVYATGTYRAYSCRHRGIPFALGSEQNDTQRELEGYLDAAKERIENPQAVAPRRTQVKRMRWGRRSQSNEGQEGMDFLHNHYADGDSDDGPAGTNDPTDPADSRPRKQARLSAEVGVDDAVAQHGAEFQQTQTPDPSPAAPVPPPELPSMGEPVVAPSQASSAQLTQGPLSPPPPAPAPAPALAPQAAPDAVPHQDVLRLLGVHPRVNF